MHEAPGGHGHDNGKAFEQRFQARQAMDAIPHKIIVMSGKGGVGKTTLAVNLAYAFAAQGWRVGILDADIHGPDVAWMTGVEGQRTESEDGRLMPLQPAENVKVLSMSAFLPDSDSPVIWRGPMKMSVIQQFMGEGQWEDTEVLVVDCPPGTGDEPLSVVQLMPHPDGTVVVTSPQGVALLDSRKCVNFARKMNLPVLGIVENLSGFVCSHCGHTTNLFKTGGGEAAAQQLEVPFLGRVPISEKMVDAGDNGQPLVVAAPDDPASLEILEVARQLSREWKRP